LGISGGFVQGFTGINTRLNTLVTQTDSLETGTNNIANYTSFIAPNTYSRQTTSELVSGIQLNDCFIFNIQGTSFAAYDQYLQIFDESSSTLKFSQKIKSNENFNIDFPKGLYGLTVVIKNSLTPISHTFGNRDLIMTISLYS
jgi:hypothetical protein